MKKQFRLWHKWLGLGSCLFIFVTSMTALALSHRELWLKINLESDVKQTEFSLDQARVWAADPFDRNHFLGADQNHLYESQDQGLHWQEIKLYVPAEHLSGISFSQHTRDLIWIALQDIGIYYSDDGGYVWDEIVDLPFNPVSGEKILALNSGADDQMMVKTNIAWYLYDSQQKHWKNLTQVQGKNQSLRLQEWIWRLHTGKFGGHFGIYLYDLIALCMIFLALSGIWISIRRKPKKRSVNEPQPKGGA